MNKTTFLKNCQQEVLQIIEAVESFNALPKAILFQKPSEEKWSIAACLEHLNIYARYYIPAMEQRLTTATASTQNHIIKHNWVDNLSIKSIHPDNRKPSKTLKKFNPIYKEIKGEPLKEFLKHQQTLLSIIQKMEHVDMNKIKVPVEFFKLLKLTLGGALEFVIRHEQRHLMQMQEVLELVRK